MSRDFRPIDLYFADASLNNQLRNSTITMKLEGEEDIIITPSQEIKDRYPQLSFLFEDFKEMYETHKENENVLRFYDDIETELSEIISKAENDVKNGHVVFPEEKEEYEDSEKLNAWFYGQLDDNFYYHERNNELLSEYLNETVEKIQGKDNQVKERHTEKNGRE